MEILQLAMISTLNISELMQDETMAVEISPQTVQNMSRSKWTVLQHSYTISNHLLAHHLALQL